MSSAAAGTTKGTSGQDNRAEAGGDTCPSCGGQLNYAATSAVSAEAEQGDGPASASATSSGVSENAAATSAVSVACGSDYAAAACDFGVVAVGPNSAAAASQVGVATTGPHGGAASSNAANASQVEVNDRNASITIGDPVGDKAAPPPGSQAE